MPLYWLNGLYKWIKTIKPTIDNKYVLAVPISELGRLNNSANDTNAAIDTNEVNEAGKALKSVCEIKCPDCFVSFASKAKKNECIPILNIDTIESEKTLPFINDWIIARRIPHL